jgi:hypothetical protein
VSGGVIPIVVFALVATTFALVVTGCGASAKPHHAAPPQLSRADRMKALVRTWTENLNSGNNAAETQLFLLPTTISLMEGPYGCLCLTRGEVLYVHTELLCTAEIVSVKVHGKVATTVFRLLGDRLGSTCDSPPGSLTGVRFTFMRGKITRLQQVWFKAPGRAVIRTQGRVP